SKGSVFPDELAIPRSVNGLIMVLFGGIQTIAGPIIGAISFTVLEDQLSRLDYWRAMLGAVILFVVLLAPQGIAGGLQQLAQAVTGRRR
ncbi:MAG: ABC transporter permease, partial [Aestuariivirgaceae bacterium]